MDDRDAKKYLPPDAVSGMSMSSISRKFRSADSAPATDSKGAKADSPLAVPVSERLRAIFEKYLGASATPNSGDVGSRRGADDDPSESEDLARQQQVIVERKTLKHTAGADPTAPTEFTEFKSVNDEEPFASQG